jgi:hypothetical protein
MPQRPAAALERNASKVFPSTQERSDKVMNLLDPQSLFSKIKGIHSKVSAIEKMWALE